MIRSLLLGWYSGLNVNCFDILMRKNPDNLTLMMNLKVHTLQIKVYEKLLRMTLNVLKTRPIEID
jgi:hypothetical protein